MIKIKILKEKKKQYDPEELSTGVGEEYEEHDVSPEQALKFTKDHLKKHSHYYSDLKQANLSEEEASNLDQQKKREVIAWKNSRWMFLDTETTGLPPDKKNPHRKDPRVVQIGYAIVDNMKIVEIFNQLVDPGEDVEIDPAASAITGIDRQKLISAKAQKFNSVIEKMKKDIESCSVVMSYNNQFDKPVVEREFKIAGVDIPQKRWLDPLIWVRKHLQLSNNQLKTVAQHYEVSLDNAHDAGADAEAAAKVTMAFVKAFDGLPDDADEVINLQGIWAKEYLAAKRAVSMVKVQIKEYNHEKYKQWLENENDLQEKIEDNMLLVEAKLSKYWKARAKRRALKAERQWPNTHDRDWALAEQEKSHKINEKIYALFEKELQETDNVSEEITNMMRRIRKQRKEFKLKREAAKVTLDHPKDATNKRKNSGSLSNPTNSVSGGAKKGFDKKRKSSKTPVIAPLGQFGPGES